MRWSIAGLGFLFLMAACASLSPLPRVETASSVHFETDIAACTAINIGGGSVLTAGHCVSRFAAQVEEFPATIQWLNRAVDVALFQVPELANAPFSELACREPVIGEDVMIIADTRWKRDVFVFGKVASDVYLRRGRQPLILFDMRGAPGNSGAPVYDTKGRVLAMMIATIPQYGNMIAAVPGSVLCELIEGDGEFTPPAAS